MSEWILVLIVHATFLLPGFTENIGYSTKEDCREALTQLRVGIDRPYTAYCKPIATP